MDLALRSFRNSFELKPNVGSEGGAQGKVWLNDLSIACSGVCRASGCQADNLFDGGRMRAAESQCVLTKNYRQARAGSAGGGARSGAKSFREPRTFAG